MLMLQSAVYRQTLVPLTCDAQGSNTARLPLVNYRPPIEVAASISIATQPLRVRAVCNGDFLVVLSTTGVFTKHPLYLNFSDLGTHFLNIAYLACEYFGPLVAVLPTILSKQSYCCRYFAFRPAQAASITFEHTADACDGCQQCQVTLQGLLRSTILAIAYSMSQVLPLALAAWRA